MPQKTPIPDSMFEALSRLMASVVDRDYPAVAAHSRGRLNAVDVQRRLEEDYQGPLALPPRDHYNEDVLLDDDDPGAAGFYLDLWDGEDIADLHLIGYLEPRPDGTYEALLSDILP